MFLDIIINIICYDYWIGFLRGSQTHTNTLTLLFIKVLDNFVRIFFYLLLALYGLKLLVYIIFSEGCAGSQTDYFIRCFNSFDQIHDFHFDDRFIV